MNSIFYIVFGLLSLVVCAGLVVIIRNAVKISGTFKLLKKEARDHDAELSAIDIDRQKTIIIHVSTESRKVQQKYSTY